MNIIIACHAAWPCETFSKSGEPWLGGHDSYCGRLSIIYNALLYIYIPLHLVLWLKHAYQYNTFTDLDCMLVSIFSSPSVQHLKDKADDKYGFAQYQWPCGIWDAIGQGEEQISRAARTKLFGGEANLQDWFTGKVERASPAVRGENRRSHCCSEWAEHSGGDGKGDP